MKSKICNVCHTNEATKGKKCYLCFREHRKLYTRNWRKNFMKLRRTEKATPTFETVHSLTGCALGGL